MIDGVIVQGGGNSGASFGLGDALGNGKVSTISPLSTINPADIVSMEILKDASATAIYGAQGANGVVLITTKRGKEGEAKISYDGLFALSRQTSRIDMMNLREYSNFYNEMVRIGEIQDPSPLYADPSILGAGTNWQDAIFQTALQHQHQLSVSGGTEKVQYYVSGSYMDQEGTIIGSKFDRFSVRTNLDAQLKKWIKLGLNVSFANTNDDLKLADSEAGLINYSLSTLPDIPIYDVNGEYSSTVREGYTSPNPVALAMYDDILLTGLADQVSHSVDVGALQAVEATDGQIQLVDSHGQLGIGTVGDLLNHSAAAADRAGQPGEHGQMVGKDLGAQRNSVLGGDGGIGPDLEGQLIEVGLIADTSGLHRVIHLFDRRIDGVNRNHTNHGLGGLIPIRGNITATLRQGDLHIKCGIFTQSADVQLRVQDLDLAIGLNVAGSNFTGTHSVDVHSLDTGAVQLHDHALNVQNDLSHVLGNTGDGGELMLNAGDLDRSSGVAGQTAQQNAAQGVAQSHAVATLQRLHNVHAVGSVVGRVHAGNARLFNFNHE